MLPLISNVLPASSAAPNQSAPANPALLLSSATDASAASRQQLSSAVTATGAPAAYFPGTAPQRAPQAAGDRTLRVPVPPPTGDYIEIEQPAAAPAAAQRFSVPVTLGIPLTTQLNAQFMAQQGTRVTGENSITLRDEKGRDPAFGTARGASAYSIAAARSASIDAAPEPETPPMPDIAIEPEPVAAT